MYLVTVNEFALLHTCCNELWLQSLCLCYSSPLMFFCGRGVISTNEMWHVWLAASGRKNCSGKWRVKSEGKYKY